MKRKQKKSIAELLGANVSVDFLNAQEFIMVRARGKLRSRKVRHFGEYEASQARPVALCTTSGQSFSHCLYIAIRHCKDFPALVGGYRILSGEKGYPMQVQWYRRLRELRPCRKCGR